jgi:adenosylmethionine-8-amino-7-oxononanoate aminotransferase
MMTNQHWKERDLAVLWHPCTQMKDHEQLPMIPVRRGKGVWLEDFEGKQYLDAISSWWVNIFGHANPHINAAISRQLSELEHVLLAGFTHEPVIRLSEKLVAITPPGLQRCFFTDNGSSAVEVALKMSFNFWLNKEGFDNPSAKKTKPKRTKFINLANSYHGETLGALAVGDVSLYKNTYEPLLMQPITAPSPDSYYREAGESAADYAVRQFAGMETILEEHAGEVCAVIVEPLVQVAGNVRMYDAVYLEMLRAACDRYDVHLIADEIAVGFGRTGTMFACEQAGISPDFMCLSKGLTGGYLPLATVLTTDEVYQAFYDDYENLTAFLHSHSYTGNALGCSAALATLELFEQRDVIKDNQGLAKQMADSVAELAGHSHVSEVRQCGMIVAMEMVKNKVGKVAYPWQERRGLQVYEHALSKGVLLRPLGNVVYFMPPYVINEEEIKLMASVAQEGIDLATRD